MYFSLLYILKYRKGIIFGCILVFMFSFLLQYSWTRMEYSKRWMSPLAFASEFEQKEFVPVCMDRQARTYGRTEDIFCSVLPPFIPGLKNPCYYDYDINDTQRLRCVPYFYIIGIDKSGSTDLHSRIVKHPLVMGNKGSLSKETQFWSWTRYGIFNKRHGLKKMLLDDFIDMFSETADHILKTKQTNIITGEASPMDLWDFRFWPMIAQNRNKSEPTVLTPHYLKYIYKETPKFIIIFREPIERLYSDYIFLRYGNNPHDFHVHAVKAIDLMNACFGNFTRRYCYFSDALYQKLPARIHLGCYSIWLKEWFRVYPRSAFHIIRTDEYQADMLRVLNSVFTFLQIPTIPESHLTEIVNETRRHVTVNKTGAILPETVQALRTFYNECNRETADLLKDERYLWLDHYS